MNYIDFTQLGGYRLEQPTLAKMQQAYYDILAALIGHFGVVNPGKYIVSGCQISDTNITPGIMYIDGHLCSFAGVVGTSETKLAKLTTSSALEFENGTTPSVFVNYSAVVNEAGTALSEFTRVPSPFNLPENIVIDANYNNFSDVEKEKLEGIEEGAEVNVQADCNETNPDADAFIKNFPDIISPLARGVVTGIADINNNMTFPVTFGAPVSTDQYIVLGSFQASVNTSPNSHNNLTWATNSKTINGFNLLIHETAGTAQNVRFEYLIIPIN